MTTERFNQVIEEQIQRCKDTLIKKGDEYATEDRLHNFHAGAGLCQRSPEEVCVSFMLKHIVSIYDMCRDASQGKTHPQAVWDEKLGDAINYMLLLSAVVREKVDNQDAENYMKNAKEDVIDIRERMRKTDKDLEYMKYADIDYLMAERGIASTKELREKFVNPSPPKDMCADASGDSNIAWETYLHDYLKRKGHTNGAN